MKINGITYCKKSIPQSYYDAMFSKVDDEQDQRDLELWLEMNDEDIMM